MQVNEIIAQIVEVREMSIKLLNQNDPSSLTHLSLNNAKLATLNSLLTPKVAEAKTAQIDIERAKYIELGETVSSQSKKEYLVRMDEKVVEARERYTKVEMFNKDIWKLLDHIRTHISAMKEETKS